MMLSYQLRPKSIIAREEVTWLAMINVSMGTNRSPADIITSTILCTQSLVWLNCLALIGQHTSQFNIILWV